MKHWLTICCFIACLQGLAQLPLQSRRDSLTGQLQQLPEDSAKVLVFLAYADSYNFSDISKAIPSTDSALRLAKKINWPFGIARACVQMGRAVADTGNLILSNKFYQQALGIDLKLGNKRYIASDLSFLAMAYNRESDFPNALKTGLEAVDIAETIQDDSLRANVMTVIAITYLDHKNYPKGTEWVLKGKALAEKAGAQGEIVNALQHLAYIRYHEKNKTEVKRLLRQALAIARTLNEPATVGDVLAQLGEAELDSPATALKHLYESRSIFEKIGPASMPCANALTLLGKAFADTASKTSGPAKRALLDSAIASEKKALEILLRTNNRQYLTNIYDLLAASELELGHNKATYDYYILSAKIYDSLFSEQKKRELSALQSAHDLEIKDRELQTHKLEATDRRRKLIAVVSGLALVCLIVVLLVRQNQQRKKTSTTLLLLNNQLEEANNIKARFFGILSHDLRSPVSNLLRFLRVVRSEPGTVSAVSQEAHQQKISRSAEELLETMEAMLLWSKEQMDSFRPDIRPIPVDDLFTYLEKFFQQEPNIRILFQNPEKLHVSGDENYLRVIMQNLTSNALKALNGHPEGLVEWKALKKGDQTVISVTDNGPGLNREQTRALYSDISTVNARTGFGFHLIRDLAKAIHFSISIASEPGKGTTFELMS